MAASPSCPSVRGPLLVLLFVFLTGCSLVVDGEGGDSAAPTPSPASRPEVAPDTPAGFDRIPGIVAEVQPSIVSINVTVEQQDGRSGMGAASGVIWSDDGIIITNDHVVAAATDVEVVLANGARYPAEVIATDPRTDLAVVRIDATGLPAANFADRLPDVGELAVALGNPLGFQNSASAGIISGLDRALPATGGGPALVGLLQTDAPISSGNSGGALVDGRGQVVGINVAALGAAEAGAQGRITAENVGFAIPSTTVISVVEQLLEDGQVSHPFLGIRGATLTPQIAERFGIERDHGVVVAEVVTGGPAEDAGIRPGDVIVSIAGEEIRSFGDLAGILRAHDVGDAIEVVVVRNGEEVAVELILGELPAPGSSP